MTQITAFSRGIRNIPDLAAFFPEWTWVRPQAAQAVAGWGLRPTAQKARRFARERGLPYIALEDGFVRSPGLGVAGWPPFALVWDDIGIYYDTSRPSRLEQLILAADMQPEMLNQAAQAMQWITGHGLSKYNHAPDFAETAPQQETVLLIDQTFGDMAVQYGGADAATFEQMFQAALTEHPHAQIWVKTHPDVLCGKKRGYLTELAQQNRVRLLAEDINPISLLKTVNHVYCVTSQMGFEALLLGKPVNVFGLPWYAGWGITDDRHPDAQNLCRSGRRAPRNVLQLFAAAYLQYSRYINPNTGASGTLFDVLDYLSMTKRLNDTLRGDIYCVGMSLWKQAVVKPFFRLPACRLHFIGSPEQLGRAKLPQGARILAWGNGKEAILQTAKQLNLPVLRMEDGFVRSVGLGSNLVPPLSLVADDLGIYFNAQTPSRLEHMLQNQDFDQSDIQAAAKLANELTAHNISKYNVGQRGFTKPETDQTVILVPGQVEDDASVRFGSPQINRNLDLLKTVRERNPDAYIIYKPHPDVVSGNRIGQVSAADCARYADQTAAEADIADCLFHADEVHTMTSLTGFEALLRGKTVYCYGLPFYAGWGLTHDALPCPRRTRRLSLHQLVAGTLLHYPCYVHPERRTLINAATAVAILKQQKQAQSGNDSLKRSCVSKQLGKIKQLYLSLKSSKW